MEQAGREAMILWGEREHRRWELLESLDIAKASIARGEGVSITEDEIKSLTFGMMARMRTRIDADPKSQR